MPLSCAFVFSTLNHARRFPYPRAANLRCGAWYTPPSLTTLVSYFKSTDGHTHQWAFSLKRPNLHLVHPLLASGGCIIVDSTTRGKSMPDALSKTVPVWCAVLNRASWTRYGTATGSGEESMQAQQCWRRLDTYPGMVGASEREQIEEKVDAWTRTFLESDLDVPRLDRPLRPFFITQETTLPLPDLFADDCDGDAGQVYTPILLVSASKHIVDSFHPVRPEQLTTDSDLGAEEEQPRIYVQGAGDDHENWAQGLTPTLFWRHRDLLLSAAKEHLPRLVAELVRQEGAEQWFQPQRHLAAPANSGAKEMTGTHKGFEEIGRTGICLLVSKGSKTNDETGAEDEGRFGLVVYCSAALDIDGHDVSPDRSTVPVIPPGETLSQSPPQPGDAGSSKRRRIHLDLRPGKRAPTEVSFPPVPDPQSSALSCLPDRPVLLRGTSYDHVSSCAVLLLSLLYADDSRNFLSDPAARIRQAESVTKQTTQHRVQWLVSSLPHAAPSRTYLLRINDYLISPRYRHSACKST
ncbi:related to RIT1 - initiator tRNA phosphoribosyl-transferase [Pseudozyma flocculosa]|uniref:Related to RIT1 - initiator tRNA phosphoribosyl-transferase n=1 Tax=Pseudozyma flocculosa TaxID=84751 RepID=A0A5C3F6L3_9BASI|nr:related to RIT1 - initiator tRNA phosphoribosyl-transferase [Pseudozyma flocculosa]